jgi:hypothetical protein
VNDNGFTIPPKIYDFLKYVALVILPATAALIIGIGQILGWSPAVVIAGIVTLVDTFLGAILGKSSSNFKAQDPQAIGDLVFGTDQDGNAQVTRIAVNQENPVFAAGSKVYLNVVREVN